MKYRITILLLLLGSFFVFCHPYFVEGKMLISQIQIGGVSSTDEFVELYNYSSSSVSLSNLALKRINSKGGIDYLVSNFGVDSSIEPFGYFLVAHPGYSSINNVGADLFYTNKSCNSCLIENDGVILVDKNFVNDPPLDVAMWGLILESPYSCGLPIINFEPGKSAMRLPNTEEGNGLDTDNCSTDFTSNVTSSPRNSHSPSRPVWSPIEPPTSTPETPTTTPTVDTSTLWSQIKINEVVSDPSEGNEWVELFNPSTSSLDLAGGFICDSRDSTSTCKDILGIIEANDWLKIDLETGSYLNNDGDSVILKNPNGDVVDRIDYAGDLNAVKGQSLARISDGLDTDSNADWAVTTQITSGTANIITAPTQPQNSGGGGSSPAVTTQTNKTTSSTTSTVKTVKAPVKSTEKFVGLKWKIKYDPIVRQNSSTIFDVSKTLDPRGGKILFTWNFGDERIFGSKIKHTFASSGLQTIIINATSSAGTIDEKKIKIMVYPSVSVFGSGIIISEINSNSSGDDDEEFLSIKNISFNTTNISNWTLAYKNDTYNIPTGTYIAAGGTLTFYKTITGFALNNTEGEILLLNQDDILIDDVDYGKSKADAMYIFNGKEWQWVSKIGLLPQVLGVKIADDSSVVVKKTTTKKTLAYSLVSILEAREKEKGEYVIVSGIVDSLPGNFGTQYFYISGDNGGMQIYQSKKLFPPLAIGDSVRVKGMVSAANGIKRINVKQAADISVLSKNKKIIPIKITLSEVNEDAAGLLVEINGEITEIKSNTVYIDDGETEAVVYLKQNAKIDKSILKEGEKVSVVGLVETNKDGAQVWPRSNEDIKVLEPAVDLSAAKTIKSSSEQNNNTKKYLIVTIVGLSAIITAFLVKSRLARKNSQTLEKKP